MIEDELKEDYYYTLNEPGVTKTLLDELWQAEKSARECYRLIREEDLIGPYMYRTFLPVYEEVHRSLSFLPTMQALDILDRAHFLFQSPFNLPVDFQFRPSDDYISDFISALFRRSGRFEPFSRFSKIYIQKEVEKGIQPKSLPYVKEDENEPKLISISHAAALEMNRIVSNGFADIGDDRYSEMPFIEIYNLFIAKTNSFGIMSMAHSQLASDFGPVGSFAGQYFSFDPQMPIYPTDLRWRYLYDFGTSLSEAYEEGDLKSSNVSEVIAYQYLMVMSRIYGAHVLRDLSQLFKMIKEEKQHYQNQINLSVSSSRDPGSNLAVRHFSRKIGELDYILKSVKRHADTLIPRLTEYRSG